MGRVTFESSNPNDLKLLISLARRLNIKAEYNKAELNEAELTAMAMRLSEKSLEEEWKNEDDEYWAGYLK